MAASYCLTDVDLKGLTFGALTRTGATFFPNLAIGLEVVGFESFALGARARFVAAGEDCLTATLLLTGEFLDFFDTAKDILEYFFTDSFIFLFVCFFSDLLFAGDDFGIWPSSIFRQIQDYKTKTEAMLSFNSEPPTQMRFPGNYPEVLSGPARIQCIAGNPVCVKLVGTTSRRS